MTPTAATSIAERYERVALDLIVTSKTNPRTHFNEAYLTELANSIAEKGVIQPILVRPKGAKFEIVAGECRFRASQRAFQPNIPAVIRDYTDEQVLELQLIENIHRQDLTALEQAKGYRALIDQNPTKHSAQTIADRIGMSVAWVWDRLKLNDLILEAKKLLEQDRFTVGHAILLARLKPEDQARAIDPDDVEGFRSSGLWAADSARLEEDDEDGSKKKPGKYDHVKPVSIREFEQWIAEHVRFDVAHAAKAVPLEFEETAAAVAEAEAKPGRGKKVIPITFSYRVSDDARDDKQRTYGSESWERADGEDGSKTCDHSVLGVVAAGGQHYGKAFEVCVARDKCLVHFGAVIRRKKQNEKLRETGHAAKADRRESDDAARREREAEKERAKEARWNKFRPALNSAARAAAAKMPASLPKALFAKVIRQHGLPADTTPASLQRALLVKVINGTFTSYAWHGNEADMVAWAKLLGVDVAECEPETPEEKAAPAKGKKAKKGKA